MGNKKKRGPDLDELLARPWCYYCERDFDDLKILIDHQRAKHFKCDRCHRRLNTAGGLSVHLSQVHKETLTTIENALPNRANPDIEIFGTTGIPQDVDEAHRTRVLTQYAQAEAERRAVTGNPAPGSNTGESAAKKPKIESKEDIKKRMAEFKAKKAAAAAAGASTVSSPSTPGPIDPSQGLLPQQQYATMPPQQAYAGPPPGFIPPPGFQPVHTTFSPPAHMTSFNSPQGPPFQQTFSPPQAYQNPMMGGFGGPGQFSPGPAHGGFPGGPPNGPPGGFPRPYGAQSPPAPYGQQGQFQPPHMNTPPQAAPSFTGGQGSNGHMNSSGLPQRPVSGAPPLNPAILQQMHKGQYNAQQHTYAQPANGSANSSTTVTPAPPTVVESTPVPQVKPKPEPTVKKTKKEDKGMRMVYSDNEVSPEEKMSKLSRYSFQRNGQSAEGVTVS